MKIFILGVAIFSFLVTGFSQAGYLGKNNGLNLQVSFGPSYRMVNKIDNLNRSVHRMKIVTTSYLLQYSRVLARNVEFNLSYQFANVQCTAEDKFINEVVRVDYPYSSPPRLLDEPRINYHGAVIGFNFFRLGSIAPVGKFIGFSFSFGRSSFDTSNKIGAGFRENENITSSFFKTVSEISEIDIHSPLNNTVTNWNFKLRLGRNYPLTDFLMLSAGMSFPIISKYSSGLNSQYGFQMLRIKDVGIDGNWRSYFMQSIKAYQGVTFDIGLKFLF